MREVTFGFVKPDAYDQGRRILGEFILPNGLSVVVEKNPYYFTEELSREHYKPIEHQPFFENVVLFTTYGLGGIRSLRSPTEPVKTALYVLEGEDAVRVLSEITGPTNPGIARATAIETNRETIRSKYGGGLPDNAFHRADSHKSVRREIILHFTRDELPEYVWEMLNREPYV